MHPRPALERLHRVALERRRQAGAEEPGAGHGGVTVAAPDRIGRLGRRRRRSPPSGPMSDPNIPSCSRSPRWLAVTPSRRTLSPRTSGRASSSATRQIGSARSVGSARVRWRVMVRKLESRILTWIVPAFSPADRSRDGDAVGHRQQGPLDHVRVGACRHRTCARGRPTSPGRRRRRGRRRRPRARAPSERAVLPEPTHEQVLGRARPGRRSSSTPYSRSASAVFSPTPHSREIGSGARNVASWPGGTTTRPSGLRRSDAILATSFVVATPTDAVSSTSARDRRLDRGRDRRPVTEQRPRSGHVEEGLVDRDRLDQRREPAEDRHDLATRALVLATVDGQEDTVRAERIRGPQRHRRVDADSAAPRSDAAQTTPRPVGSPPPTMTGLPRSSGRSRCSTAAKNASRSTWRIVGTVTRLSSRRTMDRRDGSGSPPQWRDRRADAGRPSRAEHRDRSARTDQVASAGSTSTLIPAILFGVAWFVYALINHARTAEPRLLRPARRRVPPRPTRTDSRRRPT